MQDFYLIKESDIDFWKIHIEGKILITHYGEIGANGTHNKEDYENPKMAQEQYEKLVKEKISEGYQCFTNLKEHTIKQHVEVYQNLCTRFYNELCTEEYDKSYSVEWHTKPSAVDIDAYEKKIPFILPESLKQFWLTDSTFRLGTAGWMLDGGGFNMFEPKQNIGLRYLIKTIEQEMWGGSRDDLLQTIGQENIDYFNSNFIIIGLYCESDDKHTYLYFTSKGGFGKLKYDQNDLDDVVNSLNNMRKNIDNSSATLNSKIAECIDLAIYDLLIWYNYERN